MMFFNLKIARFTSLLVALGLLLGLTVTGCSSKDRDGGQVAEMIDINYKFIQQLDVSPKANLAATKATLTAYKADGQAVAVEQTTDIIAEHQDITPADMVGGTIWSGTARVESTATSLVLTYCDADGNEVGVPDVLTNVVLKNGAVFDFTVEPEVGEATWDPVGEDQTLIVGQTKTIGAKDADGNELSVALLAAGAEVTIDGAVVTAVEATVEGQTVDVTAVATDADNKNVYSRTYHFTVLDDTPEVIWTPNDSAKELTVHEELPITAKDDENNDLVVTLSTKSDKVTIDNDTATVTAAVATAEDEIAQVTATASNAEGKALDTKVYDITVKNLPVAWTPVDATQTVKVKESMDITASNADGELSVSLKASSADVAVTDSTDNEAAKVTGSTLDGTAVVTATAIDASGNVVDKQEYQFSVTAAPAVWAPATDSQSLELGLSATISAKDENNNPLNVSLISADPNTVAVTNNTVKGVALSKNAVTVTASAADDNGVVYARKTYQYNVISAVIDWEPATEAPEVEKDKSIPISARYASTDAPLTIKLSSDDTTHIAIDGTNVKGLAETTTAVVVKATASTSDGIEIGHKDYQFSVTAPAVTWDPDVDQIEIVLDAQGRGYVEISCNSPAFPDLTVAMDYSKSTPGSTMYTASNNKFAIVSVEEQKVHFAINAKNGNTIVASKEYNINFVE